MPVCRLCRSYGLFYGQDGVRRRQIVIELDGSDTAIVQAGAMQWMAGSVRASTGIKRRATCLAKWSVVLWTKKQPSNPEYGGQGLLVLEPTYK